MLPSFVPHSASTIQYYASALLNSSSSQTEIDIQSHPTPKLSCIITPPKPWPHRPRTSLAAVLKPAPLCKQKLFMPMETTIEFSPGIPFPVPFDVQKRIQELYGYLDPNNPHHQPEQQ